MRKAKNIIIRLSEDLHYQLKLKTTKEKISIQELVETFVKDYVKEEADTKHKEKKKD